METPLTLPKKGAESPIFGPSLLWPNGWMDQDATWYGGRSRRRPHCARWGSSSPKKAQCSPTQFSAHVCYGQTAGWIKMPLVMKVCFGPGHSVLQGDPASPLPKKGAEAPISGPCLLWPNGRPSQLLLRSCIADLLQ